MPNGCEQSFSRLSSFSFTRSVGHHVPKTNLFRSSTEYEYQESSATTGRTLKPGSARPDATLPRYENKRVSFHDMQTQLQRSDLILRLL